MPSGVQGTKSKTVRYVGPRVHTCVTAVMYKCKAPEARAPNHSLGDGTMYTDEAGNGLSPSISLLGAVTSEPDSIRPLDEGESINRAVACNVH